MLSSPSYPIIMWTNKKTQRQPSPFQPNLRKTQDQTFPRESDIILGRGTVHTKHQGNARLYQVADSFLAKYCASNSKAEKTIIIHAVYQTLCASGQRFLKLDDDSQAFCVEIDEDAAKKKIGHTMRYRQARLLNMRRRSKKDKNVCRAPRAKNPTSVVTPPSTPKKNPKEHSDARAESEQELFSNEMLESVLGQPGEMDLPQVTPCFFPFMEEGWEEKAAPLLPTKQVKVLHEEMFPLGLSGLLEY